MYFDYGEKEIDYLCSRDKRLAGVIDRIGHINRETDSDLFASVIHHIIGQQISGKALSTIWSRLTAMLPTLNAEAVTDMSLDELQAVGISYRKAEYIMDFARQVRNGSFDIEALKYMTDEEVVSQLCSLKGIGVWTAEMIMIFCLQRQDIVSYGDLAIIRGMRMLYRHRDINREKFQKYCRRYSPYGTVASLYLWEIAGGAMPELTDPARKCK